VSLKVCVYTSPLSFVYADTRWSLYGFLAASTLFLPWLVFFSAFGQSYFSPETFSKLDITQIPVREYGI
jgi:hypothetical protein